MLWLANKLFHNLLVVRRDRCPKMCRVLPAHILEQKISYYKAWQGRKHAQSLIRDSLEESFYMLPSYCYMLEKVNPETVTRIEVDGESRFKYLFLAFGVAIRGFQLHAKSNRHRWYFFEESIQGCFVGCHDTKWQ